MEPPEKRSAGIAYECINCNAKVTLEQLSVTPEVKCPICGYRVLRKSRALIVKHVKAR
jgi:DNA-directed RNA polymerase subunit RPC12/RpoP